MERGARRQRLNERSLIRPLIIASGRPARLASTIMFGHSSQLGDQRRVRAPVEQEAAQEERIVERGVLVQRPRRQAPGEQRRGRHRAGRHQRGRPGPRDALDERQERDGFADARPVQPDEPAQRAGKACAAAPLADPLAVLLAASEAQRQERDGERRPDRGQRPVGVQRERRGHAVLRFAPGSVAPTIA